MTIYQLVRRSLRSRWPTNLTVVVAIALCTAVLLGALLVGDSVRGSLVDITRMRLGHIRLAMQLPNRFCRSALVGELGQDTGTVSAGVIRSAALAANADDSVVVNRVELLGVDDSFWQLSPSKKAITVGPDEVVLNEGLANKLGVETGSEVFVRFNKPSLLPGDAPLSKVSDLSAGARLSVEAIITSRDFGDFSLKADQVAPYNAIVGRQWLAERIDQVGKVNMILLGGDQADDVSLDQTRKAVKGRMQLEDVGLQLREIAQHDVIELRSERVFIEPLIAEAAAKARPECFSSLGYFVNELRSGERTLPYSIVAAVSPSPRVNGLVPPEMSNDEIIINEWLAEDLAIEKGAQLELTYYVMARKSRLEQRSSSFTVREIIPIKGAAFDPDLMPAFPGLAQIDNCRDWQPGFPVDLDRIRDKDQEYWELYRGTPKAFIALQAGQNIWKNRFGNLTALRYPSTPENKKTLSSDILAQLEPQQLGISFQPVRSNGLNAAKGGQDYGQLFLGFSLFLIVSALLLMGLLFVLSVEHRREEVGTLFSLGFPIRTITRLLLWEAGVLVLFGVVLGIGGGLLYTWIIVHGLATIWQGAVGTARAVEFHANFSTVAFGSSIAAVVAISAIWLTLRSQMRKPTRESLSRVIGPVSDNLSSKAATAKKSFWIGLAAIIAASVTSIYTVTGEKTTLTLGFFITGTLLLIGQLLLIYAILCRLSRSFDKSRLTIKGLALRNCSRRPGRSMVIVALLACAGFLIIAVGANRHDPMSQANERSSGTGGFAFIGESAMSVFHDLNSLDGRKALGLLNNDLDSVRMIQLRVKDGDDASCLNLNRPQRPPVLSVPVEEMIDAKAFSLANAIDNGAASVDNNPWQLLRKYPHDDNVVPALADDTTITWILGKKLGDDIIYIDDRGNSFPIRLVGSLKNSILQGNLLIAEDEFIERFSSVPGYRMFLIDAPSDKAATISGILSKRLRDFALELTPATQRLASIYKVENTYLSIFGMLGGLGLLLGGVGLAIVVLRHVLERRPELALLIVLGFTRKTLRQVIVYEHGALLFLGLFCGVVSALVAIGPILVSPSAPIPYLWLALTLGAIVISSLIWTMLAASLSLRTQLLEALRNE